MTEGEWLIAGVLAAVLAAAHFFAVYVARWPDRTQAIIASLGGGAGVAYVFVHLLPELASGGRSLSALDIAQFTPTPIVEASLFLVAMVGLSLFYVLDVRTDEGKSSTKTGLRVHLVAFASISVIYGYTMPSLITTGWDYAVLLTIVLVAHVILADRTMARAHPDLFRHETRWVGLVGLAMGLAIAVILPPVNELSLAVVTAFLGGSLLMTTLRNELPAASTAKLPWFITGVTSMSLLLLVAVVVGQS